MFRGWQGQLPLDLVEKDRSVAGKIAPEFFTRAGEARQLPAPFVEAIHAATKAVCCVSCTHSHFLVEPTPNHLEQERPRSEEEGPGKAANGEPLMAVAIG